ncbi:Mss4-like protein [Vararia minispora EC-137]|uniref:Mss4-like protein n=1 Tax=Vararia minispora EC-137 TaxID=1314806 RepID=A0ACB8QUG3_9AGAM|nr:Mss4-like protein [Vararia minispora EC-137]
MNGSGTGPISLTEPLTGGCFCGAVSYALSAPPTMSAYCHCTQCQRLNGCPFVHTVHFRTSVFGWTHDGGADALDAFQNPSKPHKTRFRCKKCGCCVASFNKNTNNTSVWGAQLSRSQDGRIMRYDIVKPTAHIFYGTRMLDVPDEVTKWEGYPEKSRQLA